MYSSSKNSNLFFQNNILFIIIYYYYCCDDDDHDRIIINLRQQRFLAGAQPKLPDFLRVPLKLFINLQF